LSLLQLVCLYAVAGFTVFTSIAAFDCVHTACVGLLVLLLLLTFLLLLAFLLL
jgi:hypothetical protein